MKWHVAVIIILSGCLASPDAPSEPAQPETEEQAEPSWQWADPDDAVVRPGLRGEVYGEDFGVAFTFGFMLASPDNATMYISTVAHALHLMEGRDLPVGSNVSIDGQVVGSFVYDGWADETGDFTRDFALIELNEAGRRAAHPAVMSWQGPTQVASGDDQLPGWRIFTYGMATQEPNEGRIVDEDGGLAIARMEQPLQPGDSGSPILAWDGGALGLAVAYMSIQPLGPEGEKTTFIVSFEQGLADVRAAGFDVELATAPFEAPPLPL